MKIAIVGSFDYHLECIGFLLEMCDSNTIDIYLHKKSDKYSWIEHYLTIYNFNVIYNNFHSDIINNYDKVFKLTSNDNCLDDKKIISIMHLDCKITRNCKSEKFISFTPYIKGDDIHYIFPIYSPILIDTSNIDKNVTMIGYYLNRDIDNDMINFINKNNNYTFIFIIWGDTGYPNLKNIKNVKLLSNVKTDVMNNIINNSKFILSKKAINYDRFSGQLSLAMSYEKPLIVDRKTKDAYNLPGITFNNNYSEIGSLDDITDEKYKLLKNEIKSLKNELIDKSKTMLNSVF